MWSTLPDGTQFRTTPAGYLLVRGKREVYITAKSVTAGEKARTLMTTRSFNSLFQAGRTAPGNRNAAHIKL